MAGPALTALPPPPPPPPPPPHPPPPPPYLLSPRPGGAEMPGPVLVLGAILDATVGRAGLGRHSLDQFGTSKGEKREWEGVSLTGALSVSFFLSLLPYISVCLSLSVCLSVSTPVFIGFI